MPLLAESKRQHSQAGRATFAVLLFQDLAVAPILITLTIIGSQGDSTLGIVSALHFAVAHRATAINPAELTFHLNTESDILTEPVVVRDGMLTVPDGPGLGVQIDAEKLARYRVQ